MVIDKLREILGGFLRHSIIS